MTEERLLVGRLSGFRKNPLIFMDRRQGESGVKAKEQRLRDVGLRRLHVFAD